MTEITEAMIYAVRLDAEAVRRDALEEAAALAEGFVGEAKRRRIASGWKMSRYQPHERDEIAAEENGGNIAAQEIAEALRALASADRSGEAGETALAGSTEGESAVGAEGAETPKSESNDHQENRGCNG